MKLSARNQLKGKIIAVTKGQTTAHVRIDIGNGVIRAAVECRNGRNESGVAVTRWGSSRWTGSCWWTMIRRRQEPVVSARRRKKSGVQPGSPIPLI
ncbi:MAG TPA: TOBE domain-containing protein [Stellaceae bacterium]